MNLKEIRFKKNLTQCRLGLKANISQPRISLIETGQYLPSQDEIQRIAEALEVPIWRIDWPGDVSKQSQEASC